MDGRTDGSLAADSVASQAFDRGLDEIKAGCIVVPLSCTCLLPRLCSTNGIIGDGRQGFTVPPDVPGRWRFLGPTTKLLAAAEENTVIMK